MQDFDFLRPKTLLELTGVLAETSGSILAGGTDIIPKMRRAQFAPSTLVDVSRIDELSFIKEEDQRIFIGALTTHQEIADSALLADLNPALVAAALSVGCEQTRNRGTLGGNIANASPAADTIPPLLVIDADIHLLHISGERTIPLDNFLVSAGKAKLLPGELIHSVSFQPLSGAWGVAFMKLGKRNGMAISVVSAAAGIELSSDGKISKARLCLGSVAPRVVRSQKAEERLTGYPPKPQILDQAAYSCLEDIAPISDIRSSAEYRNHSAVIIARRVLEQAVNHASRRMA